MAVVEDGNLAASLPRRRLVVHRLPQDPTHRVPVTADRRGDLAVVPALLFQIVDR